MKYLLILLLSGCSIQSGFHVKCDGKCEASINRDAEIEQPQGLSK